MRSTGKEPSPEDGPPAQTGVFTSHYLNMQALRTPYLPTLLLCAQAAPLLNTQENEEEEEEEAQNKTASVPKRN
ncbi:hypothetical protein CDA61_15055 [Alcaligenes faecalis]|nr:hypothetical protein CDA61_15055 [Alcaligenes faecalis]